jgi:serine/threonine-protein kinase RsbW
MTEGGRIEHRADSERTFPLRRGEFGVLRALAQWTHEVTDDRRYPRSLRHDVDLALQEAVSNVIRHGIRDEAEHSVSVRLADAPAGVRLVLSDDAAPFDPLRAAPVPQAATLADASRGGRGILLLRAMTREMRYEFMDGRNILTLVFDREPQQL